MNNQINIKELILLMVQSDFRLRYQGSYLGYLWTLFKPLLLFGVIFLVFSQFLPSSEPDYAFKLLLALVFWQFFSESTATGMASVLQKRELITKIYFPRELVVISAVLTSSITLFFNLLIFLLIFLLSGKTLTIEAMIMPLHLLLLVSFSTGIALLLSSLIVRFHDMQHIWEVLLQLLFWLTPIIYPLSLLPQNYHSMILLSPLARLIEYSRFAFLQGHLPSLNHYLSLSFVVCCFFFLGFFIFRVSTKKLAENI